MPSVMCYYLLVITVVEVGHGWSNKTIKIKRKQQQYKHKYGFENKE